MRYQALISALLVMISALPASAQRPSTDVVVGIAEDVLTRAALERGASIACARGGPEADAAVETMQRGWRLDLADTAKMLGERGVPADVVQAIVSRFDLDAVTPRLASDAERKAFCAVVGDGWMRYQLLRHLIPQFEIRRTLDRR